jgi:hypothetical protein
VPGGKLWSRSLETWRGRQRRGERLHFQPQSRIVSRSFVDAHRIGRVEMAKGQLRSNKEKKKPKQSKKPAGPAAPFGSTQNKPSPPAPAK